MASQLVKRFRTRELASVLTTAPKAARDAAAAGGPVKVPNPFVPHKNPATGRWAPAKYSRRRQAELVKAARATNSLHLLPPGAKLGRVALEAAVQATPKSMRPRPLDGHALWAKNVSWTGKLREKKVAGADVGNRLYAGKKRMFKGHKWQRTMPTRELRRRMLLKSMKSRVRRFRSVRAVDFGCSGESVPNDVSRYTAAGERAPWVDQKSPRRVQNFPFNPSRYHRATLSFLSSIRIYCFAARKANSRICSHSEATV